MRWSQPAQGCAGYLAPLSQCSTFSANCDRIGNHEHLDRVQRRPGERDFIASHPVPVVLQQPGQGTVAAVFRVKVVMSRVDGDDGPGAERIGRLRYRHILSRVGNLLRRQGADGGRPGEGQGQQVFPGPNQPRRQTHAVAESSRLILR